MNNLFRTNSTKRAIECKILGPLIILTNQVLHHACSTVSIVLDPPTNKTNALSCLPWQFHSESNNSSTKHWRSGRKFGNHAKQLLTHQRKMLKPSTPECFPCLLFQHKNMHAFLHNSRSFISGFQLKLSHAPL